MPRRAADARAGQGLRGGFGHDPYRASASDPWRGRGALTGRRGVANSRSTDRRRTRSPVSSGTACRKDV
ncbi:hypothetical protein MPAR168_04070 [Methylorubrum populi]|uniref:Uncharacterized protein n=1 Tax=Methylobacterium radiotolerans TaxID=31998 RepID=A0ABU7TAI7_9HYPH